jgi:hypothetical protein
MSGQNSLRTLNEASLITPTPNFSKVTPTLRLAAG